MLEGSGRALLFIRIFYMFLCIFVSSFVGLVVGVYL